MDGVFSAFSTDFFVAAVVTAVAVASLRFLNCWLRGKK